MMYTQNLNLLNLLLNLLIMLDVYILLFQKVGYKSDIGYQTILYGNIVDMRRILMFLIEKLPKEIENTIELKSM